MHAQPSGASGLPTPHSCLLPVCSLVPPLAFHIANALPTRKFIYLAPEGWRRILLTTLFSILVVVNFSMAYGTRDSREPCSLEVLRRSDGKHFKLGENPFPAGIWLLGWGLLGSIPATLNAAMHQPRFLSRSWVKRILGVHGIFIFPFLMERRTSQLFYYYSHLQMQSCVLPVRYQAPGKQAVPDLVYM